MLKQPLPSNMRRTAGRVLVIAILSASGYAAWAAQPATAPAIPTLPGAQNTDYSARIEFSENGGAPARFFAAKDFGQSYTMIDGDAQGRPSITATVQPVLMEGALAFDIAMRIEQLRLPGGIGGEHHDRGIDRAPLLARPDRRHGQPLHRRRRGVGAAGAGVELESGGHGASL